MQESLNATLGHVLIVDDNEANREVLSRRLERHGFSFATAEDGLQALEMMRDHPFDIIILDIMMPRMNGYQVLEAMKTDAELAMLPVIVVSAVSELESIVRCVELGAEDYLFKPFNPVLLKARLTAILEKKRLRTAAKESAELARLAMQESLNVIRDAVTSLANANDPSEPPLSDRQQSMVKLIGDNIDSLTQHLPNILP